MSIVNFVKNHEKSLAFLTVVLAGTAAYAGYYGNQDAVSYITENVKRQQKVVNAIGEMRAIKLVTVGAQVTGKIENLYDGSVRL